MKYLKKLSSLCEAVPLDGGGDAHVFYKHMQLLLLLHFSV